ncbi:MAG: hypothetical protein RJB58_1922 [Pseudomonadota bacterium]
MVSLSNHEAIPALRQVQCEEDLNTSANKKPRRPKGGGVVSCGWADCYRRAAMSLSCAGVGFAEPVTGKSQTLFFVSKSSLLRLTSR